MIDSSTLPIAATEAQAVQVVWNKQNAIAYVNEGWGNQVAAILDTGRRLIEAKANVAHGEWQDVMTGLAFGKRTAQTLMQIARHPDLANAQHVAHLPASWGTLAVLAKLPEGVIPHLIAGGTITAETTRAQAQDLVDRCALPQFEQMTTAELVELLYPKIDALEAPLAWTEYLIARLAGERT